VTLDILRLDITKDLLRKMAKEERCLFLALGHASNQVNALWKLVIILTNGDADDPVKQRGPAKISFRYRQFRKSY
jgi:ABC-type Na+ transport system ATPase subunit NatA